MFEKLNNFEKRAVTPTMATRGETGKGSGGTTSIRSVAGDLELKLALDFSRSW